MASIAYRVVKDGDGWSLTRNGEPGMSYVSQEAAFEVAVGEAGSDLRSGHDVVIQIPIATDPAGAMAGAENRGRATAFTSERMAAGRPGRRVT